jgi:kynurenine formamidase
VTRPGMTDWIDVSVTVRHGMPHWLDNPPIVLRRIPLQACIWIIKGLGPSPVTGGRYEMICLPVKLHGSDGALVRAILRPFSSQCPDQAAPAEAAP